MQASSFDEEAPLVLRCGSDARVYAGARSSAHGEAVAGRAPLGRLARLMKKRRWFCAAAQTPEFTLVLALPLTVRRWQGVRCRWLWCSWRESLGGCALVGAAAQRSPWRWAVARLDLYIASGAVLSRWQPFGGLESWSDRASSCDKSNVRVSTSADSINCTTGA